MGGIAIGHCRPQPTAQQKDHMVELRALANSFLTRRKFHSGAVFLQQIYRISFQTESTIYHAHVARACKQIFLDLQKDFVNIVSQPEMASAFGVKTAKTRSQLWRKAGHNQLDTLLTTAAPQTFKCRPR